MVITVIYFLCLLLLLFVFFVITVIYFLCPYKNRLKLCKCCLCKSLSFLTCLDIPPRPSIFFYNIFLHGHRLENGFKTLSCPQRQAAGQRAPLPSPEKRGELRRAGPSGPRTWALGRAKRMRCLGKDAINLGRFLTVAL